MSKAGLADLHSHVLPGIDDGAKTMQEAEALLRASAQMGITNFVFTPHYYPERIELAEFLKNRDAAVESLRPAAEQLGISFRVGAEIQITPILAALPLEKLAFSGTHYLLLELLAMYEPHDVEGLIRRIRDAGYTPILAHIERFPYIEKNPELLYRWVKAGALAQVNAGWLQKDKHAIKRLKQYYGWNLVHLLCSDTHASQLRPQNLLQGYDAMPEDMAREFRYNAMEIFSGREFRPKRPIQPVKRFGGWK